MAEVDPVVAVVVETKNEESVVLETFNRVVQILHHVQQAPEVKQCFKF